MEQTSKKGLENTERSIKWSFCLRWISFLLGWIYNPTSPSNYPVLRPEMNIQKKPGVTESSPNGTFSKNPIASPGV